MAVGLSGRSAFGKEGSSMKNLAITLFVILLGSSFPGQPKVHQKEPEKIPWAYGPGLTGRPRTLFPGLWSKDPIVPWQDVPTGPLAVDNIEAGGEHFIQEFADKWIDGKTVYLWSFWTSSKHVRHVTFTVRSWPTRDEVLIAIMNSTLAAERLWSRATHPDPTPFHRYGKLDL
jgi:hypothetical protein